MKMTIDTSIERATCRQFRTEESQSGAPLYYSAWYYLPQAVTVDDFWNILQFKSKRPTEDGSDPFWTVNILTRDDGQMALYLRWRGEGVEGPHRGEQVFGTRSYSQELMTIPVGEWFHVEVFLRQSSDFTGRVTVWQDGQELFDLNNVRTQWSTGDQRWSVNNYSDGLQPDVVTMYIDDAAISSLRVWQLRESAEAPPAQGEGTGTTTAPSEPPGDTSTAPEASGGGAQEPVPPDDGAIEGGGGAARVLIVVWIAAALALALAGLARRRRHRGTRSQPVR